MLGPSPATPRLASWYPPCFSEEGKRKVHGSDNADVMGFVGRNLTTGETVKALL